jgi:hypothetical protein
VLLAEVEAFFSRPIAPTRRVALGDLLLPCDPAPGFGGVLLGGIAARFGPDLDRDWHADVLHLMSELERGRRIAQPRLRHRLQEDRIGLQACSHQLVSVGERVEFRFEEDLGTPAQHVLCAVYAAGGVPSGVRTTVMEAVRKGFRWQGELGAGLLAHLTGQRALSGAALGDPVSWAMGVLDLRSVVNGLPNRRDVQRAFRRCLIDAHPDHGAADAGAAQRIAELTEARRILLG